MKSPWVSREQIESVERARAMQVTYFEKVVADLREDYATLKKQNADLTERLLSLKMAGAVETMKSEPYIVPELLAIPQAPPDDLRDLIDAKSGGNLRKRGMMLRQLAQDRADGVDSDTIRAAIENGVQGNGVPS